MPITAKQETGAAFDFRVNQVEFDNPVTGDKTGLFANIRQDNNEILGVVSKRYSIVNNADILGRADSALESAGMPFKRKVYSLEGGRKMKAYYDIGIDDEKNIINESMTRKVAKGDIMGFRLIAQNSFDRTLRVSFALGLIRLVCTNGMTTMEKEISMIKKHSASFNLDDFIAGDALETAIKRLDKTVDVYKLLAEQELSQEQGLSALNNLTTPRFKKVLSEKAREGVARIWNNPTYSEDKGRNLYNLNNAVTQYFTHDQDSIEYAQRSSKRVLEYFEQAAHSSKGGKTFSALTKNEEITVVA